VVDEIRVLRLLRSVTDDLAFLRREAGADQTRRADPLWLRGVKYTFVTALEACVDVAQHVCAAQGWGPPSNNADAVRVLGRHGVLGADLAQRVARAVGFRNGADGRGRDLSPRGGGARGTRRDGRGGPRR
jgi:uncharacterized protein YutE (UPF0331/DUF86 family)